MKLGLPRHYASFLALLHMARLQSPNIRCVTPYACKCLDEKGGLSEWQVKILTGRAKYVIVDHLAGAFLVAMNCEEGPNNFGPK